MFNVNDDIKATVTLVVKKFLLFALNDDRPNTRTFSYLQGNEDVFYDAHK